MVAVLAFFEGVVERLLAGDLVSLGAAAVLALSEAGLPLAGDLEAFEGVGSGCLVSAAFGSLWAGVGAHASADEQVFALEDEEHEVVESQQEPNNNNNNW